MRDEYIAQWIEKADNDFYAVEIRYPDEFYTPTFKEASECFKIASAVKSFVLKKIDSPKS